MEASDYLRDNTRCERCRKKIDGNTAYQQQEWSRFGRNKIKVTAWYCDDCHQLLISIGAGEYTAMEERAGVVPSYEPAYKGEF